MTVIFPIHKYCLKSAEHYAIILGYCIHNCIVSLSGIITRRIFYEKVRHKETGAPGSSDRTAGADGGAVALGPTGSAVLGLVFGITSFAQCFGISAFGTVLCGISPLLTLIVTIGSRTLAGYLTGVVSALLRKAPAPVNFAVTGLAGAVLNTLFFMTLLMVCFGSSDYIMSMRGELNVLAFVAAFVGINAVVEAVVSTVLTLAVSMGLKSAKLIGNKGSESSKA